MEDIPRLRREWADVIAPLQQGLPDHLPPFREVNHTIPLIDETVDYKYHHPRCPDNLRPEFFEKLRKMMAAGWWESQSAAQAAPLLCIPKPNGKIRTVLDARKRNANTIRDVTPFPDQDQIRADLARAPFRSKIDMSDAYEQIRVVPEDVHKTAFATIAGTYVSHTMQIGDCNAPSTFQRLMTVIFRNELGKFVHVYLDDIFIYSYTIEEHQEHIATVVRRLKEAQFFISKTKVDLYSERLECLGHLIDKNGLHADPDKLFRLRTWRTPRSLGDIQRFLGLVNYLAQFLPGLAAFAAPLETVCTNNRPFQWLPLHDKCFESIKHLASKAPILRPIDPERTEAIWVVCDASAAGVGAMYGQGPTWETCRPAGFMSKKWTNAQRSYFTFEQEGLAIIEALMKWEDRLIGRRLNVVTDHKALTFFKQMRPLVPRHQRWADYLERFDYHIQYVEGVRNKVGDCMSRYYESDRPDEVHPIHEYVNADVRLDRQGWDLPSPRVAELRGMITRSQARQGKLQNPVLPREIEAARLRTTSEPDVLIIQDVQQAGPDLVPLVASEGDLVEAIKAGYAQDKFWAKILGSLEDHPRFALEDGLVYAEAMSGRTVIGLPDVPFGPKRVLGVVIEIAHETLGHLGAQRTEEYIRQFYWWPTMRALIDKYCRSCGTCHTTKAVRAKPAGLLKPLPIPTRPWGSIAMDFVGPFPLVGGLDYVWVVIDRLTSLTHLIPTTITVTAAQLGDLYVKEIVRLHGIPETITSDRDPKFTSAFWQEVQKLLGSRLTMSTAFHPETDGASERVIQTISQVLRALVEPNQTNWLAKLPMAEFALNSSTNASSHYAPFELTYGYLPIINRPAPASKYAGVRQFVQMALNNLIQAQDAIIASRVAQTFHANQRRAQAPVYAVGDKVYLSTKHLSLPKGRIKKLLPKYIGPFTVLKAVPATGNYKLQLTDDMVRRQIYPVFHVSLLRPFVENDEVAFPGREPTKYYDVGIPENHEWVVESILSHRWFNGALEFQVRWVLGDVTWETSENCSALQALDDYLALIDVTDVDHIPPEPAPAVPPAKKGEKRGRKPRKARGSGKK